MMPQEERDVKTGIVAEVARLAVPLFWVARSEVLRYSEGRAEPIIEWEV